MNYNTPQTHESTNPLPKVRKKKKILSIVAMVLCALLLASCGPTKTKTEAKATSGDATSNAKSLEEVEASASPLGSLLGFDVMSSGSGDSEAERQRAANRAVAACMTKEGFEYHAPKIASHTSGGGETELAHWSKEWVEKYGMGISTTRFSQTAVGPNLVGYTDDVSDVSTQTGDPNEAYLNTLSDGERDAYNAALYGAIPTDGDTDTQTNEPGGCFGEGFKASYGDMASKGEALFAEFGDAFEQLHARVQSDTRVVEWRKKISMCMSERGHNYTDMDNLRSQLEGRLAAFAPSADDSGVDFSQMSERDIDAYYAARGRISEDKLPELAAIQKEEIAMAKDLVACGGGELNEAIFMADIRKSYEEKFVKENADGLAKFKGTFSDS